MRVRRDEAECGARVQPLRHKKEIHRSGHGPILVAESPLRKSPASLITQSRGPLSDPESIQPVTSKTGRRNICCKYLTIAQVVSTQYSEESKAMADCQVHQVDNPFQAPFAPNSPRLRSSNSVFVSTIWASDHGDTVVT